MYHLSKLSDIYIFIAQIINIFFKGANAIPIAGIKEDKSIMDKAFESIQKSLSSGYTIAYFPEGNVTKD